MDPVRADTLFFHSRPRRQSRFEELALKRSNCRDGRVKLRAVGRRSTSLDAVGSALALARCQQEWVRSLDENWKRSLVDCKNAGSCL